MKKRQYIFFGVVGIGLYLLSTGISYAAFSAFGKKGETQINKQLTIDVTTKKPKTRFSDQTMPLTEACPLNGKLYTKTEKAAWEKRRPFIAMIENSVDARPQSGLSYSDIIYEAIAEGGITRFMAVFYCDTAMNEVEIAPVRSVRIYFFNWASEYGNKPILVHVGGGNDFSGSGDTAPEAQVLEKLQEVGWRTPGGNDFDTTFDMGYPTFYRNPDRLDHEVATEHTMVVKLDKAFKEAEKRKLTNVDAKGVSWDATFVPWKFKDDAKEGERGTVGTISYVAWKGYDADFGVKWTYDSKNNVYLRETGGKPHTDLINEEQLTAKNIIVLFAKERASIDKNMHMWYGNIGEGTGLLFQDGKVEKITWSKDLRTDRTIFVDSKGKEVQMTRGRIWISMLGIGTAVTY